MGRILKITKEFRKYLEMKCSTYITWKNVWDELNTGVKGGGRVTGRVAEGGAGKMADVSKMLAEPDSPEGTYKLGLVAHTFKPFAVRTWQISMAYWSVR